MISFSAHSDFNQSFEFIQRVQCPNVVLVHGERGEALRLSEKLKVCLRTLASTDRQTDRQTLLDDRLSQGRSLLRSESGLAKVVLY